MFLRHRQTIIIITLVPRINHMSSMAIKRLRKQWHLSQEELAESCKLSLRTIQRVEAGHRVGYASLRALAAQFNKDVDELEQELYSMNNIIKEYKDFPLWLRLYIGSGWFSATRIEFKRIEIFFLVCCLLTGSIWLSGFFYNYPNNNIMNFGIDQLMGFCSFVLLLGAYNNAVSIRLGDKYDIWSKLEATQPKSILGLLRK